MYTHYHKGLPLRPRSLLYPVLGERAMHGWIGTAVDASSILAVAAGTIGPIGFLGLQLSYSLDQLVGIPNVYATQLTIVAGLVGIYTISAVTGINRGIQILSRFNVLLALALMIIILITGPGSFIIDSFFTSFGLYLNNFFTVSTNRSDPAWLGTWSIFFGGWFLGYGPLTAMFIARISRGRTVREILVAIAIIAPIVTNFWFTILGGSGIFYELQQPGVISGPLTEAGLPAAMLAIVQQLPLAPLLVPAFLVLIVVFLATTGDSMSFTIAMAVSGNDTPTTWGPRVLGRHDGRGSSDLDTVGGRRDRGPAIVHRGYRRPCVVGLAATVVVCAEGCRGVGKRAGIGAWCGRSESNGGLSHLSISRVAGRWPGTASRTRKHSLIARA